MHFTTDAAWHDDSIVWDGGNFLVATFVNDEVDVPTRSSGDIIKITGIQLRKCNYREWRLVQDETDWINVQILGYITTPGRNKEVITW